MGSRPAAGGGRWVDVAPGRLERWLAGFVERHGAVTVGPAVYGLAVTAADGTLAELHRPPGAPPTTTPPGAAATTDPPGAAAEMNPLGAAAATNRPSAAAETSPPGDLPGELAGFVAEAGRPRRLGLLLARRGAVAVGVAAGDRLVASKVDTHYVQGRTAAGGWSQQRFARRRENQARASADDAGEVVARLLLPAVGTLAAVVAGGDRRTVDAILADRRLAPVAALRAERLLDVPEPRHAVLVAAVAAARAVRIRVIDPP